MLIFSSDHAGLHLKNKIIKWLSAQKGFSFVDVGSTTMKRNDDYPVFAAAGVRAVCDTKHAKGIFICGSGVGMAIAANRFAGIRAVSAESVEMVRRACREDHVNVLVLGARIITYAKAQKIISVFLHTPPSLAKRHLKRIRLIDQLAA